MKIWIIADTHFNHKKLIEYEHRPINFNEIIIHQWNKQVKDDDLIIHLGDVILGQDSTLFDFMGVLKGKKILVRGNHDVKKSINWFMEKRFDFVCDYFIYKNIAFSHAPLTPLPKMGLYHYKEEVDLNIHGHFHANGHRGEVGMIDDCFDVKYYQDHKNKYYLFSLEKTFRPILLDSILQIKTLA